MSTEFACPNSASVGIMPAMFSALINTLFAAQCSLSPKDKWPADYGDEVMSENFEFDTKYDFIVIGAGTAGSIVASRLSENPNAKVLVLEAGGNPPMESDVPAMLLTLQHTPYSYEYFTEADNMSCKAFVNNQCYWPRGKMLGGSAAMNAMLFVTSNSNDYNKWPTGWKYSDVEPFFTKTITPAGTDTNPMGYTIVNDFPVLDADIYDMFFEGAAALGIPKVDKFEEGTYTGYTNIQGTIENGRRRTAATDHLVKAAQRSNVHVLKNAQVTKLKLNSLNTAVRSVEFILRGVKSMSVQVTGEVILSAGSIDSPKILQLSGIGPKSLLNSLGIPIRRNLPVGYNLQDHNVGALFIKVPGDLPAPTDLLDNIYNYAIYGTGSFSSQGTMSLTGLINSDPLSSSPFPDLQMHYLTFRRGDATALGLFLAGLAFKEEYANQLMAENENSHIVATYMIVSHPKSRGSVEMQSNSAQDKPKITANYLQNPDDVDTLLRGWQFMDNLMQTSAFIAKNAEIMQFAIPECDVGNLSVADYRKCYLAYFTNTCYHPVGTVKMAESNDSTGCVDRKLRVKHMSNLRVVDASIMPFIPTSNTNAPTMMIAEKASEIIKSDHSKANYLAKLLAKLAEMLG